MKKLAVASGRAAFSGNTSLIATFTSCQTVAYVRMPFQVCDEPHPLLIKDMIQSCVGGDLDGAYRIMSHLWSLGYAPEDIIGIVFRVCKTHPMAEYLKLEFIKVCYH